MGVNVHHDNYFDSLFKRTTESFRAKTDKENRQICERQKSQNHEKSNKKTESNSKQRKTLKENYNTNGNRDDRELLGSRHPQTTVQQRLSPSEASSFKSAIENGLNEILNNRQSDFIHETENIQNLNKNFENRLKLSENHSDKPSSSKAHQDVNKTKLKTKATASAAHGTGAIKRMPRTEKPRPEWQNVNTNDQRHSPIAQRKLRSQSPSAASSVRSGRSSKQQSVLIPRSKSRTRKPNSDPVALYQYYKNEWEFFRKQIPGETNHSSLRWQIKQRMLDPE